MWLCFVCTSWKPRGWPKLFLYSSFSRNKVSPNAPRFYGCKRPVLEGQHTHAARWRLAHPGTPDRAFEHGTDVDVSHASSNSPGIQQSGLTETCDRPAL